MEFVYTLILLALIQYGVFLSKVGAQRSKLGVLAPSTTGNEEWERLFRIQQNTLEQLIIFIPAMVLCGLYFSAGWAVLFGLVFMVGRFIYARRYAKSARLRGPGMAVSFAANVLLVLCALIGLVPAMGSLILASL